MAKVFVDGAEGTTGLRIGERLSGYPGIERLWIDPDKRKDALERKRLLNLADIAMLCLPDDAAREAVALIDNPQTRVLDASTAHRTLAGWAYGFPELRPGQREAIAKAGRVAVPGCHATGYAALTAPLVSAGLIKRDALLCCHSLSGYSGGGKKMIAQYESGEEGLLSPRIYGLNQEHKHLKEMALYSGVDALPVFSPIVANFYSGILVTLPLTGIPLQALYEAYAAHYRGAKLITVLDEGETARLNGFIAADGLKGRDDMQIIVTGNAQRALAMARFDNLGKGASGQAVQCLNLMLGHDETTGLCL